VVNDSVYYDSWKEERDIVLEYNQVKLDDANIVNILGIGIDNVTRSQAVVKVMKMIATGGTMAQAISILKSNGAKRVYLGSVHPVLTGSAVLKLCRAGVESIIATDTLEKAVSTVSVARLIAEAVRP